MMIARQRNKGVAQLNLITGPVERCVRRHKQVNVVAKFLAVFEFKILDAPFES